VIVDIVDRGRSLLLAGLLGFLLPLPAGAAPAVQLVLNDAGSSLELAAGEEFTVDVELVADAAGIASYGVSVEFDAEGSNAFDVVAVDELLPAGFAFNLSDGVDAIEESEPGLPGSVLTCEAATFGAGPVDSSFVACRIHLISTGVEGAFTLSSGIFNEGFDGLFDNAAVDVTAQAQYGEGTVTVVPEAGAASALAGAILLGLRLRRSAARRE
jgi:hypothetical protein